MWHIILGLLIIIFAIINFALPVTGFSFIAQPFLWAFLAFLAFRQSSREGLNIWSERAGRWWSKQVRRWDFGDKPVHSALLIALLQISMLVFAGILYKFGKSPYSSTPSGILMNIFFISSMLLGMELSRAYIIRSIIRKRNITLVLTLTALLYAFISIPFTKFYTLGFDNPAGSAEFMGSTLIPSIAQNLLASVLAFYGGAIASIGYLGTLKAFEWFSPVLPDLHWTIKALISTITPAAGFFAIQQSLYPQEEKTKKIHKSSIPGWVATAVICGMIIWFFSGFFPVHPTVIGSGSMRPVIETGDIVIIGDINADTIKQGDIIQYRAKGGNFNILHRVIEIKQDENTKMYITKGDANNDPDSDPVQPDQVIGKVSFIIPRLGLVGIIVRDFAFKIVRI